MATYKKRGYKKTEAALEEQVADHQENFENSTTKEVFNTLEETANKSEKWIEKNSKFLLIGLATAVVVIFGYMGYTQWIANPTKKQAADALVFAKQTFTKANSNNDSIAYKTALEGNEEHKGLIDIAKKYGSTEAGNLAKYYAGISYINLKEYENAIDYLKDVDTKDAVLNAVITGNIGDAYLATNNAEKALDYFTKAGESTSNNVIAPLYLIKAGKVALSLKDYEEASDLFESVQNKYPKSTQAKDIDLYINQAKYAK